MGPSEQRDGLGGRVSSGPEGVRRALAILGPFDRVHLAEKGMFRPDPSGFVPSGGFPIGKDEGLLAWIDGERGGLEGVCVLTTRRIYWRHRANARSDDCARSGRAGDWCPEPVAPPARPAAGVGDGIFATVSLTASAGAEGTSGSAGTARGPSTAALDYQSIDYASLPEALGPAIDVSGAARLDFGGGRTLLVGGGDPRLIEALARCLESMGASVRATRVIEGQERSGMRLPERVSAAPVAAPSRGVRLRGRITPADLQEFRRALDAATRRVIVTPAMALACLALFAIMAAAGIPILWPTASQLMDWGANEGGRVLLRQESWRLLTMVFIHGGLIHLVVNVWSLMVIGPLVERIYGHLVFAVIYLTAGIGGALASACVPPVRVSVGASGAICGILGALLAFVVIHRRSIPPSVLRQLQANALGIVAFMAVLGALVPNIDQAAHLGGLATGFFGGALLSRPWPVLRSRGVVIRRFVLAVGLLGAMAGTTWAVVDRGMSILPPRYRCEDLADQIAPMIEVFDSIGGAIPTEKSVYDLRHDPKDRWAALQRIQDMNRRGAANLDRLRQVTTPDLELRTLCDALLLAQARQADRLAALQRYLESGDATNLTGAGGALAARAATSRAVQEFQRRQAEYFARYGLLGGKSRPEP